jgi:hypothetical protein
MRDDTDPSAGGGAGADSDSPPLVGGQDGKAARAEEIVPEDESWPIGFMIVLALAALYLGWRLIQGVGWVIDKL